MESPSAQPATPQENPVQPRAVVGIGASAGGLTAFEAFFSGMPAEQDTGMAYVLVQHLSPDHKSLLTEIISRSTRMEVFEVEDGMPVRANRVYIIPPNRDMALMKGFLHLLEPGAPRGQRLPIDFFFRSLAEDQGSLAIGIVLSGTGGDGSLGLRAIKGEGGLSIAQKPETSEFDGMPLSAIATGLVDYVLAPAEMPGRLMEYQSHGGLRDMRPAAPLSVRNESAWKKIFVLLRGRTGQDFSQYKPSTIERRIERRMAVNLIGDLDAYVKFLMKVPGEMDALFRDLLIGVTQFFRDKEAFAALESQVIPRLFEDRLPGTSIRVWVAGCSTGEEAYSLAILFQEQLDLVKQGFPVQIFATDLDDRAIQTARQGRYPAAIAGDVSPERLGRFFAWEAASGEYRIHKSIREMLIFSEQNLIKDPPFSKLDLISCRNLLIYLSADLQRKIIPIFHYALKPEGFLYLGNSEGVGEFDVLFAATDRKAKIYRRKAGYYGPPPMPTSRYATLQPTEGAPPPAPGKASPGPAPSLRELTERALLQIAPAAALINASGDILYLHGRTGMYLEPAPGAAGVNNILKMAREGLQHGLAAALREAAASGEFVRDIGLRVKTNGHYSRVNLTVGPVPAIAAPAAAVGLFLVLLEDSGPEGESHDPHRADEPAAESDLNAQLEVLRLEMHFKDELLQSAKEELETSGEELKSSNEEMQSINEELQSTNEELETSKEELQSVNEELATVNAELQNKVTDLSRVNDDMANLLAGTGIATIFVNLQMRILRFTPTATEIINLIPGDVGRPVAHVVSNLVGYSNLIPDIREVLRTLVPMSQDVRLQDGRWFSMKILPYRTLENVIEGAVLSFMDISERRLAMEELRKSAPAADVGPDPAGDERPHRLEG